MEQMTNNKPTQPQICIHEDTLTKHTAQIETLQAKNNYKHEKIQEILDTQKRFEEKLDKILEEMHKQNIESITNDNSIDHRVTQLEQTVRVIKYLIGLLFGSGLVWIIINMR